MTDMLKEQISALIDDELSAEEAEMVVRRMTADASLQEQAAQMLAVSQSLRAEYSCAGPDFAASVMRQVRGEEVEVLDGDTSIMLAVYPNTWRKRFAGAGIAAVVAIAALIGVQRAGLQNPNDEVALAAGDVNVPVEYTVPTTSNDSGLVAADPALASYFLSHSASSRSLIPGGGRARLLRGEPRTELEQNNTEAGAESLELEQGDIQP